MTKIQNLGLARIFQAFGPTSWIIFIWACLTCGGNAVFSQQVVKAPQDSGLVSQAAKKPEEPNLTSAQLSWRSEAYTDSLSKLRQRLNQINKETAFFRNLVSEQRDKLIADLEVMLKLFPASPYNGGVWLRLAELLYESETEKFEKILDQHDDSLDALLGQVDSAGNPLHTLLDVAGPKVTYPLTVNAYNQVLAREEYKEQHDIALFFKALCLVRMGKEDEALELYKTLVSRFEQSRYLHSSLLKIGDYFYNRPHLENGQGYTLAADYYRKAIGGPRHPLYGEAMYKLGWCYFQQDRYAEAVSIFRSLIETADLNFSGTQARELVLNPLLREEAVEFLAVSLDESGGLEEALSFLSLVGNENYSARVLLQIANIYVERSDYEQAIRALGILLDNHPLALSAPEAKLRLAEVYMLTQKRDKADEELLSFFDQFSRGSDWYRTHEDPGKRAFVDSQAVKILVQSSENVLRKAHAENDRSLYITVAKNFSRLLEQYPTSPTAYEVEWNLALILNKNIKNYSAAYYHFMRVATAYRQPIHRESALLLALASAQAEWESGTARLEASDSTFGGLGLDTALSRAETGIVKAAEAYARYFPRSDKLSDVLMIQAAVFYNRGRFDQAIPLYERIAQIRPYPKNFQEAYKLNAGAYMALRNYSKAEEWYQLLFSEALDTLYIELGRASRVEAAFRGAAALQEKEGAEGAAEALQGVARKYPGAPLSEVALFNAAEMLEKEGKYTKSAQAYELVASEYPTSRLADGALFNAAHNQENAGNYQEAINIYERLLANYPQSPHLKNSLFNISLAYEKLGQFDKVAEASERYAQAFPGEKDAPDMLYNTGRFYFKAKEYKKSIPVFQRFYTKYIGEARELEARWYTGRAYEETGEKILAEREYNSVLSRVENGSFSLDSVRYYIIESVFGIARLARSRYLEISLEAPSANMEGLRKEKTTSLAEAVAAYEKVLGYSAPQSIAALVQLGQLYINFARAWSKQSLASDESGTKKTAAQKRIASAAGKSLDKSLEYFGQALGLKEKMSILPGAAEWLPWLDSARIFYGTALREKINLELLAGTLIVESDIPAEVKKEPLNLFLYRSKLLETSRPDFEKALKSFEALHQSGDQYIDGQQKEQLVKQYAEQNYLLGGRFIQLNEEILAHSQADLGAIDPSKKEDLIFQLEDLAFEVQDAALPLLKSSYTRAQKAGFIDPWSRHLLTLLQKMDAQNYPLNAGNRLVVGTGASWWAYPDSLPGWKTVLSDSITSGLFGPIKQANFSSPLHLPGKSPDLMWGDSSAPSLYFRKTFALDGSATQAILTLGHSGALKFYINGVSVYESQGPKDSLPVLYIAEISSFLRPGPNLFSMHAQAGLAGKALSFLTEINYRSNPETGSLPPVQQDQVKVSTQNQIKKVPSRSLSELRAQYPKRKEFLIDLFRIQRKERQLQISIEGEEKAIYELQEKLHILNQKTPSIPTQKISHPAPVLQPPSSTIPPPQLIDSPASQEPETSSLPESTPSTQDSIPAQLQP